MQFVDEVFMGDLIEGLGKVQENDVDLFPLTGSKYLGVHVNKDLSWNDHIQQTSAKASRSVGFLRRNLRGCPQDVKAQAYTTLVRPVLGHVQIQL
jgi:hypothetical protein